MTSAESAAAFQRLLGLAKPPVAITFAAAAPAGVPKLSASGPASCSYWDRAADGESFYTEAAQHTNCPIGAHTHGVTLSPEKAAELQGMVQTMVQLEYIAMSEVPAIPTRKEPFQVAVYAPLASSTFEADVVVVRGTAKQIMLVSEALQAAGLASPAGTLGRPTCAMLPAAMQSGQGVTSVGCIGNRVYTNLGDGELYAAIPGGQLGRVLEKLEVIVRANVALEKFHAERKLALTH